MNTHEAAHMLTDLEGPDRRITLGTHRRLLFHGLWTAEENDTIRPVAWKIADAVLARDVLTRLREAQPGTVSRREFLDDAKDRIATLRVLGWLQSERLAERVERPAPAYRITLNGRAWLSELANPLIRYAAHTSGAGASDSHRRTEIAR